jgi:hypothetical protein
MGTVVLKPPVDFVNALLDRAAFRTMVQRSLNPVVELANILLDRFGKRLRNELLTPVHIELGGASDHLE